MNEIIKWNLRMVKRRGQVIQDKIHTKLPLREKYNINRTGNKPLYIAFDFNSLNCPSRRITISNTKDFVRNQT